MFFVCVDAQGEPDSYVLRSKGDVVWAGRTDAASSGSFLDDFGSSEMTMTTDTRAMTRAYEDLKRGVGDANRIVVVFQGRRYNTLRRWRDAFTEAQVESLCSLENLMEWADMTGATGVYVNGKLQLIRA